jgi:2-dehydro-3-deoxyglucarate aldolase/4-hydroxy-2-oxoheptanedioate aldolase
LAWKKPVDFCDQPEFMMAISEGMPAFGTFVVEQASISTVRIAASAGADFLIFDGEHGPVDPVSMRNAVAVSTMLTVDAFVRVQNVESELLPQSLDAGARGIVIPNVQSVQEARRAVERAKFPPEGQRGAAFGSAQDGYTVGDIAQKVSQANGRTMILCMIESPTGAAHADQIASIDGIDGLWFGYIDFSIAAGIPGQIRHQVVVAAAEQVAAACRRHGKRAGVMVTSAAELATYVERGFDLIAFGSDAFVMKHGFSAGFELCRSGFDNVQQRK